MPKKCEKEFSTISSMLNKKGKTTDEKITLITKLKNTDLKSECFEKSLYTLTNIYQKE
jgi:hypothetical protein